VEPDENLLSQPVCEEADRLGWVFLAEILETEIGRYPENVEALAELGHVYTRQGRFEHGLAVDEQLVRLAPMNPTVHYNLACSLSLLGRTSGALDALERAIDLGYADGKFMSQDDDLIGLRGAERFAALLGRLGAAPDSQ
jgi:tetratricopeptide (TPR) repeat protein